MEWLDEMVRGFTGAGGPIVAEPPPKKLAWGSNDFSGSDDENSRFSGTTGRSKTNKNILNLEMHPVFAEKFGAEMEPVSRSGKQRFAKFPNWEAGYDAAIHQIGVDAGRKHTLASFVNKFAPPHENPTGQIIQQYASALGVSPDTPLSEIDPHSLIKPMAMRESSTRIAGKREGEIFSALKNPGERKPRAFDPYDIAQAGTQIVGPPTPQIHSYDPKGPNVDYLDSMIQGKSSQIPTPQGGPIISAPPEEPPPMIGAVPFTNEPLSTDTLPARNTAPAPFAQQAQASFVDQPQTMFQIYARNRFPQENPVEAAKRYMMRDGEVYYMNEKGGPWNRETGTGFTEKLKTHAAALAGRSPEIIGGTIGALSPIPGGMEIGTMMGGAARRGLNQAIYGEDPAYLAGAGQDLAGALVGRGVAGGANKLANVLTKSGPSTQLGRMISREASVLDPVEVQRLINLGNQYGITLTTPEITNSPTMQSVWAALAKNPLFPTANHHLSRFIKETRNPEVHASIQRELGVIAPVKSALATGEGAQGVAQNILGGLKQQRKLGSDPLYDIARQNKTPVDITPIFQELDDTIRQLLPGGKIVSRLEEVQKLLSKKITVGGKEVSVPVTDLEQLHSAKRELSLLQKQWGSLEAGGVDPESFAQITKIKGQINDLMIKANPDYGVAQAEYARLSNPIAQFNTGDANRSLQAPKVTSLMKRLTTLGAEDLELVPGIVFKEPAGVISKTRNWFVNNGFESEWNSIIREHLQSSLNKVFSSQANREGNFGYAFRSKAYGIPNEVEKLKAAMDPQQFGRFQGFMDVLGQTEKIIYTNSQTANQLGAVEGIKDLSGGWVAKLLSGMTINPRTWGLMIREFRSPGNAVKIADALIDPATAPAIQALQLMPNNMTKAIKTLSLVGGIMGEKKVGSISNYRNDQPDELFNRPVN